MSGQWAAELRRFLLLAVAALLVGTVFGRAGSALAVAVAVYFGWHLHNLWRLDRWLRSGQSVHPPEGSGIWGEVFYLLYQARQRDRKRKRRLTSLLHRFREATAAMPDATVILDAEGHIEWFNDAARAFLGLNSAKDVGQRIQNLLRHPGFRDFLRRGETEAPFIMPSPLDDRVVLGMRVIPYGNDQRLLLARDISQQQRLEQMRRDFVANVSHELRTPLTVIGGFLETMRDEPDDGWIERWGRSLELMEQQTDRMRRIVEDLLLLSRLETDRTPPPQEVVSVQAMLEAIGEGVESLVTAKGQQITIDCEPNLQLHGAEKELYSAFSNLMTNAVRYTPEGGRIAVRWYSDSTGAHLEVEDNGLGIAPQHIPRLTERFYRVDVGRSRESGGTGLGLAIVKHVLTRHAARLRIHSVPGSGSTFCCDFPPESTAAAQVHASGAS